jgi:sugar phosphate isomerase/epimerase
MAKLGVITDGISRDFEHALAVMDQFGLEYAELQYLWDKEVGELDAAERRRALDLLRRHGKKVACISRHVFAGMPMSTRVGDDLHSRHMAGLARCVEMAHELDCPLVRIMSGRKEMILWGSHGAETWNVAKGAWDALPPLIEPAVRVAEKEGVTLVVETGNGTMVHSGYTARKLCEAIGSDHLKVLWDPANACYCHEVAWPDGYEEVRGHLGHLHIKDVQVDTPRAHLEVRPMGEGQLADQFGSIAAALAADGYQGVVSFESVYHPGDGDFEAGFRTCIGTFKTIFG